MVLYLALFVCLFSLAGIGSPLVIIAAFIPAILDVVNAYRFEDELRLATIRRGVAYGWRGMHE